MTSRLGSKTKVVFASSPGYAGMPPASKFVYAILILIAEGNGWRMLMAARNRELEPVNLRLGSGGSVGGCVPRSKGLLRACGYLDCVGRGPVSEGVEPCPATEVQLGGGG